MSYVTSLEKPSFYSDDEWSRNRTKVAKVSDARDENSGANTFARFGASGQQGRPGLACAWEPFRKLVLMQWSRLVPWEVEEAGPDRHRIALLIQKKYGINARLAENYLRGVEKVLLAGA